MGDADASERVPAPWTLRGDAHIALVWAPRRGWERLAGAVSARHGGVGVLALIRYSDSNVGPYDELLWLAPWGLRVGRARLHTVTSIYVSSERSRSNGRREWGIPKELARFEVSSAGERQRVAVTGAAGPLAAFEISTGRRSLAVDASVLPQAAMALGQVLDGQLFRVTPSVRGRLQRARWQRLALRAPFPELGRARPLAAASLLDFEMVFPRAEVRALDG